MTSSSKHKFQIVLLITTGCLSILQAKLYAQKKFITEKEYQVNLARQLKWAPQTIAELRKYNVTEDKELQIKYVFYTNTLYKARSLAKEFDKLHYKTKFGKDSYNAKRFEITGWTTKMKMAATILLNWTKQMCQTGYKFDCDFDGWETKLE
jgi:hypothetical protein